MAKKPTPLAGESQTTNYGWVKPTVGSSVDLWGGYINADLDSIDGVVHAIDTRSAYVLPVASTTILGGVKVDGTTIKAAPDGTISTTVVPMGDNRIINGDMRIDQRNNGAGGTAYGYTIDRWFVNGSVTGKLSWARNTNTITPGFPYCMSLSSASAYTPAAADYVFFEQIIEADMVSDFAWGTASAQAVTLSFWALCSISGNFSGSITNAAFTRSYPFTYSLVAGTPKKVVVTIPGDTSGAWVLSGNAASTYLMFDLGAGASARGPANAWTAGWFIGATGSTNLIGTNGAQLFLTGVKLETGSVATPFNRQSLAKSLSDCQRYYTATYAFVGGYSTALGTIFGQQTYPTSMRTTPTIAFISPTYSNASALGTQAITPTMVGLGATITAAGYGYGQGSMTLSAEL